VAGVVEAGAGTNRSADLLRSAGDPQTCGQSTDQSPHPNCASPIQVFLWPLPGRAGEEGPPGTVKVDFVSGNPASRWDVYADDKVLCTTPCAEWIHPTRPVMLRAREDSWMPPQDKVNVENLMAYSSHGHLQLEAHPTARGKLVTGITFTSFAGMAVLTGITLAGVGCGGPHSEMCTPGLITLGVGGVALAGSIWLILDAMPRARVMPHEQGGTLMARPGLPLTHAGPRVRVGPGIIAGTF
jgi:hypothetical protein